MSGKKGMKGGGGSRPRSGPIRRRFIVSPPAALYIREVTRLRLRAKNVTPADLHETLDRMIQFYARYGDDTSLDFIESIKSPLVL